MVVCVTTGRLWYRSRFDESQVMKLVAGGKSQPNGAGHFGQLVSTDPMADRAVYLGLNGDIATTSTTLSGQWAQDRR